MLEMEISNTELIENIKCRIPYTEYLIWNSFEDNTESKCKYLRRYSPNDFNNYLEEINNTVMIKESDVIDVHGPKYNHEEVYIK